MNPITALAFRAAETAAGTPPIPALPTAASWDLVSFLKNASEYVKIAGGGLLILMGVAALVWGAVLLTKKLMAGQQNQDSWIKIIGLVIVGGAFAAGGINLVMLIGSGGRTTIEKLGGEATYLWGSFPVFGSLLGLG